MPGNYSSGENNSGNIQVGTVGGENERLSVQFKVINSGRKFIPLIIYKGAPLVHNSRRNTIAVELQDCKQDIHGNCYPPEHKVYLSRTRTEKPSGDQTIEVLKNVIVPEIGIPDGTSLSAIVDYFKGHSK